MSKITGSRRVSLANSNLPAVSVLVLAAGTLHAESLDAVESSTGAPTTPDPSSATYDPAIRGEIVRVCATGRQPPRIARKAVTASAARPEPRIRACLLSPPCDHTDPECACVPAAVLLIDGIRRGGRLLERTGLNQEHHPIQDGPGAYRAGTSTPSRHRESIASDLAREEMTSVRCRNETAPTPEHHPGLRWRHPRTCSLRDPAWEKHMHHHLHLDGAIA